MTPITIEGRIERTIGDNDELGRLHVCLEVALSGRRWNEAGELLDQMAELLSTMRSDVNRIECTPS